MNSFTKDLRFRLDQELRKIERSAENTIQIADQSLRSTESIMKELKDYILQYNFMSIDEEITFFKEVKPNFLQDLIFYTRTLFLELQKPLGSKERLVEYFNTSLNNIGQFMERNQQLYTYYKIGNTSNDRQYFTRGLASDGFTSEYTLDIDPRFSTLHSLKLAKIIAYERLRTYIHKSQQELNQEARATAAHKSILNWTDSKVALIELVYALHARGAVDSGKTSISQLIKTFESAFNVELANFYRMYLDMSIRKKNKTPFLDSLKENLDRYMVEGDR